MLRKLLNWFFGPYSYDGVIPAGDFIMLLQKNFMYLRQHRCRVLSTELPDELLKKWLLPIPGDADADEYMRSFSKKDTLSENQLPVFVFDYVLRKRFNWDIATFDEDEMKAAANDLRIYVLLLNYIFGMRESGRP